MAKPNDVLCNCTADGKYDDNKFIIIRKMLPRFSAVVLELIMQNRNNTNQHHKQTHFRFRKIWFNVDLKRKRKNLNDKQKIGNVIKVETCVAPKRRQNCEFYESKNNRSTPSGLFKKRPARVQKIVAR